ncbi:MAG: MATE family efflux transporter [Oscillospiraceae bacterium]|nr:MATE family efflux transporter [Oscillospiraceae bacterium]
MRQPKKVQTAEDRNYIFESVPVPKAILALAGPTVLSQIITLIYNLVDTFFVGQLGDPYQVAAVSVSLPLFFIFFAVSNLFGTGGGSLIARMLGAKRPEEAKKVCAFSFYCGIFFAVILCLVITIFRSPLLHLLGASNETYKYSFRYTLWVSIIGGIPTACSIFLAAFFRSEGRAKQSSFGMMIGGVANIILDPIFIFALKLNVEGAAIATMLSTLISVVYFALLYCRVRHDTVISFNPKYFTLEKDIVVPVFSVGLPAAFATVLGNVANAIINKLTAGYGDIQLAAMGIVKKIDMLPMHICMGLGTGILPIMAYNYAAKNYDRMKKTLRYAEMFGVAFALFCIAVFEIFAPQIMRIFIAEQQTVAYGEKFLRVACLCTPLMTFNFLMNSFFQATGHGTRSLFMTCCRQGIINIPLLFVMRHFFALDGIVWTQTISDALVLGLCLILYTGIIRKLEKAGAPSGAEGLQ